MNQSHFGLIGFACDEGVRRNNGRVGAIEGPKYFREALAKINGTPPKDFGDIRCDNGDLEAAQIELGKKVYKLLSDHYTPIVIGGGHETAWGHFQGISQFLGDEECGIINFDAHFDLRPLKDNLGTSGTPFLQIAQERASKNLRFDYLVLGIQPFSNSSLLFETAKNLDVNFVLAENLAEEANAQIDAMLARHKHIYLSICLDVFAECFAPGVSAPQALGLLPMPILPLLKRLQQSQKVIAIDIVELAPVYDRQNTTSKLATSLMAYLMKHT